MATVWNRVYENDLEKCLKLIKNSAEHYKEWGMSKLEDTIKRKKAEIYYYKDKDYEIMLSFTWNFTKKMWRIKHGAFKGTDGADAMRISWEKVREFYKSKGEKKGYLIIPNYNKFKNGNEDYFRYMFEEIKDIKEKCIKNNLNLMRIEF